MYVYTHTARRGTAASCWGFSKRRALLHASLGIAAIWTGLAAGEWVESRTQLLVEARGLIHAHNMHERAFVFPIGARRRE